MNIPFKDVVEDTIFKFGGGEYTKVKQWDSGGCCGGYKPINARRNDDNSNHYFSLDTEVEVES